MEAWLNYAKQNEVFDHKGRFDAIYRKVYGVERWNKPASEMAKKRKSRKWWYLMETVRIEPISLLGYLQQIGKNRPTWKIAISKISVINVTLN